jgi:aryl-alcohol dehydrogenase-like predicted oxidoreductase
VALAWLKAQGEDVVPIPGVERRDLLTQNVASLSVPLGPEDLARLDAIFAPGVTAGNPDHTLARGIGHADGDGAG